MKCNLGVEGCTHTHSCDPSMATHYIPSPSDAPDVRAIRERAFSISGGDIFQCDRDRHALLDYVERLEHDLARVTGERGEARGFLKDAARQLRRLHQETLPKAIDAFLARIDQPQE